MKIFNKGRVRLPGYSGEVEVWPFGRQYDYNIRTCDGQYKLVAQKRLYKEIEVELKIPLVAKWRKISSIPMYRDSLEVINEVRKVISRASVEPDPSTREWSFMGESQIKTALLAEKKREAAAPEVTVINTPPKPKYDSAICPELDCEANSKGD